MKQLILFLIVFFSEIEINAQSSNIVYQDKNARFTQISDGVIRMEYAPDGRFIDNKSFVTINRTYSPVQTKVQNKGKWVEIKSKKMIVSYKKNSGIFTADNLKITSVNLTPSFTWKPGMKQTANLKGTFRTLDQFDGDIMDGKGYDGINKGDKMPIEDGILARDGWTLIDDSRGLLFDGSKDWDWVKERDKQVQDWYFMAYGHDYKSALYDFTIFSGKVPLPPRYAFGYWWSRYWAYSDGEMRELIRNFHEYNIPCDVLVIDMDWHYTRPGKGGWTGWTWNKSLFPDHKAFLKYLKDEKLKVTLNLHPSDGFYSYEECFPRMAKAMGTEPSQSHIPWISSDKKMMTNFFHEVIKPMEKDGVDFWWLDWQQALKDPKISSLNNTWWLNYAFFTNMENTRNERPMLYHRWGGLGNHRYQIGFSGDAVISWKSLDFQPYFNSTASNVLYGYWSHDLGGHMHGELEPEMYVRWMQFGALSPIMRTHSTKNATLNKEIWAFKPEVTKILKQTIRQRYEMVPYIYTMARKCYNNGISLCRPMYYDYPEEENAYTFRNQYMFGDNIIVSPITKPAVEDFAENEVWLPQGIWYEMSSGTVFEGGRTYRQKYKLDEYPVFVKAGSIIPFYQGKIKNLVPNDYPIAINVFPGGDGNFTLYEDNGNDKNYKSEYATTDFSSKRDNNKLTIHIGKRCGLYADMPTCRQLSVKVHASAYPDKVIVNGQDADYQYDGKEFALIIKLPTISNQQEAIVTITYPATGIMLTDGIIAKSRRIANTITTLKFRNAKIKLTEELASMSSLCEAITYYPEKLQQLVQKFNNSYSRLPEILKSQKLKDTETEWFLKDIDWKQSL